MTPDDMLMQLKENANRRKKRSLELIHQICLEQYERGSKDFSIAMIGRLSEKQGGPKTQSIRNKGGTEFRALIKTWGKNAGGSSKKIFQPKDDRYQSFLQEIERPDHRAVFTTHLSEIKKLRREIDILRKQLNRSDAKLIIDKRTVQLKQRRGDVAILPSFYNLNPSEIEALKNAISNLFFAEQGWTTEENGRVLNAKGRFVYRAGYVTAIKKVLESVNNSNMEKQSSYRADNIL